MPKNTIRPASRCWSNFDPPRDPRFPLSSFPDAHKPRSLQHGPLGAYQAPPAHGNRPQTTVLTARPAVDTLASQNISFLA